MGITGLKRRRVGSKSDLRCVSLQGEVEIQVCTHRLGLSRTSLQRLHHHRGFVGGGFGFGTPVVSYAPRPMLQIGASLVIMRMLKRCQRRCECASHVEMEKGEQAATYSVQAEPGWLRVWIDSRCESCPEIAQQMATRFVALGIVIQVAPSLIGTKIGRVSGFVDPKFQGRKECG